MKSNSYPIELEFGLKTIKEYFPHIDFTKIADLQFIPLNSEIRQLRVVANSSQVKIYYVEKVDAFRGLMLFFVKSKMQKQFEINETTPHRMNGSMIDMSRNAVNTIDSLKKNLVMHALLGLNMLTLYTEDTYEVSGEPFFGYKRGRYSKAELRQLDAFAYKLGIEMFPCIQTLGHFEQVLQWPKYHHLRDTDGILMAGEHNTLKFIEKLIQNSASVFRSKRIHLGMDEAIGIGAGFYRDRYGAKEPFEILSGHLKKIESICKKYDLEPMIWSDMYFRLGSKTGDYYDVNSKIPETITKLIPSNMSLVYWDYYHTDEKIYQQFIKLHRKMKRNIMMATGIWTWSRFWAASPFTFSALGSCMRACRKEKVEEVFATLWRDDGAECIDESFIPGYIFYAESCFNEDPDSKKMQNIFKYVFGGQWSDFMLANELDYVKQADLNELEKPNMSKMLLWQDPILGHLEGDLKGLRLNKYYEKLSKKLFRASRKQSLNFALELPAQLALVLSIKADLYKNIKNAMQKGNCKYLKNQTLKDLKKLKNHIAKLCELHQSAWIRNYKPNGFEILANRYGGLIARICRLEELVLNFTKDSKLPEEFLEESPKVYPKGLKQTYTHRRCVSPAHLWTGFNY